MINQEKKRIVVGISDLKISDEPGSYLITFSLGSCIGAVAYDPKVRVGGILHFQLPSWKGHENRVKEKPFMFADSGIPLMLKSMKKAGGSLERMVIGIYGGASILNDNGLFKIGIQNTRAVKKIFWQQALRISSLDVGGTYSRTVRLDIATGKIEVSCIETNLKAR